MSAPTLELVAGFEASQGTSYAFYDVTDYNDGTTYAPDVIEHDITAYGREGAGLTVTRGVQQVITTGFGAQAGVLSVVLDNRDRRFDPNYFTGPYVEAGTSRVAPNVPIILRTTYNAVDYDVFYGYADDWPQGYPAFGKDQVVPLEATDATQLFANTNVQITRPAEQSGERIRAIIAAVGYEGPTSIGTGNATISALTRGSVSAWSHMVDVANTEWGDLYFSKSGVLTFRSRDQIFSQTRSVTSQATFGDSGTDLRYSGCEMASKPLYNRVVLTYSDRGLQVTADNATSQREHGMQVLNLTLPFALKAQAQQYANWIVQRYADYVVTFASIEIRPSRGNNVTSGANNLLPQAFGRELGDRITVKRTPLSGPILSADVFIRGITHSYQNAVWQSTKFTLQDAEWTTTLAHYNGNNYDDGSVYAL